MPLAYLLRFFRKQASKQASKQAARVIPTLETLEDRVVPTTLPVANPDTFDVFNAETLYRLPDGLSIDATTGIISGTLTAIAVNTGYPNVVTVLASTANYVAMQSFLWNVAAQVPAAPAVLSWVGAANGGNGTDWTDPKNWTGNRVSNVGDKVEILNGPAGLINVPNNVEVAWLTLDAGVSGLTGNGNITVRTRLTWMSGQISGAGTLTLAGDTNVVSPGTVILSRPAVNQGKMLWQQGDIQLDSGIVFTNNGTIEIQNDGIMFQANPLGTELVVNSGRIIKTMGPGPSTQIQVKFNHVGLSLQVNTGVLVFLNQDGIHSGQFTVMGPGEIRFQNGSHTFMNGAKFIGPGKITVRDATLIVQTGATVINEANFRLTGTGIIQGSGTGANAGHFVNNLTFLWEGGILQSLRFSNSGTLTVDQQFNIQLDSSVFTNFSSFKWVTGDIEFKSNLGESRIRNLGSWEAQDDSQIVSTNGMFAQSIVNDTEMNTGLTGRFSKTGGLQGGKTRIEVPFTNNGTINNNGRMIEFAGNS